jgi:hypothetical protein
LTSEIVVSSSRIIVAAPVVSKSVRYQVSDSRSLSCARFSSVMSIEFPRMAGRPPKVMEATVSRTQRTFP